METKGETDKQYKVFDDIWDEQPIHVSLYSALKGYATIICPPRHRFDDEKKVDLDPETLRYLAKWLNYCAKYIEEITPKY